MGLATVCLSTRADESRVHEHVGSDACYEGVTMRENLRGPALRYGVFAKVADNYAALFAVAELDPDMTERVVFFADYATTSRFLLGRVP